MAVKKQGKPKTKPDTVRLKQDIEKDLSRSKLAKARADSVLAHHPKTKMVSPAGRRLQKDLNLADSLHMRAFSRNDSLNAARKKKSK